MAERESSAAKGTAGGQDAAPPLPPGVKLVCTLRGHTDCIGRIAWSPDGRMLASPSDDKTIRLWDAETGQCLRTLTGHAPWYRASPLTPRAARWPAQAMTGR